MGIFPNWGFEALPNPCLWCWGFFQEFCTLVFPPAQFAECGNLFPGEFLLQIGQTFKIIFSWQRQTKRSENHKVTKPVEILSGQKSVSIQAPGAALTGVFKAAWSSSRGVKNTSSHTFPFKEHGLCLCLYRDLISDSPNFSKPALVSSPFSKQILLLGFELFPISRHGFLSWARRIKLPMMLNKALIIQLLYFHSILHWHGL